VPSAIQCGIPGKKVPEFLNIYSNPKIGNLHLIFIYFLGTSECLQAGNSSTPKHRNGHEN
jgi:hypothetical protein